MSSFANTSGTVHPGTVRPHAHWQRPDGPQGTSGGQCVSEVGEEISNGYYFITVR